MVLLPRTGALLAVVTQVRSAPRSRGGDARGLVAAGAALVSAGVPCAALLAGCTLELPIPDTAALAPPEPVGGLVGIVRGPDDGPIDGVRVDLGSTSADPDLGGAVIFLDVPPGRALLEAHGVGFAPAWAPVDVPPHHLASTQLHPAPTEPRVLPDAAAGGAVDLGWGTLTVTADTLTADGAPAVGELALEIAVIGPEASVSMPGDLLALSDDEIRTPVDLYRAFYLAPPDDAERRWRLEEPATVSLDLPEGAPELTADGLALYRFDGGQGYWRRGSDAVVADGAVSGAFTTFGWWAVGSESLPPMSCLVGVVQDPAGAPLPGAEVLLTDPTRFGSHRAAADADGRFCVAAPAAAPAGATAELRLWAMGQALTSRWSGAATVPIDTVEGTCGGTCTDARTLTLQVAR